MPIAGRFRYLEVWPSATAAKQSGPTQRPPTLVLLHAFPLNARMWEPQMALAEQGWRIVAPQFRGFDDGAGDPLAASVDDYAGDVIDLLDRLHVEQAVVGGLSMGGYVAFALLRYAARYVRALILADTRPQADTPDGVEGRKRMLRVLEEQGPPGVAGEMIPKLLGPSTLSSRPDVRARVESLAQSNSSGAIAGAIHALMTRPDATALLPTVHCPTLIVVGDEDSITPPAVSEEMHRAIAGSELVVIPGAGHLSSLEQPAAFNSALARFLTYRV